ncbi:hypothetical protein KAJ27_22690 [bacterium]|nr:hypothetical protein [bacterium]
MKSNNNQKRMMLLGLVIFILITYYQGVERKLAEIDEKYKFKDVKLEKFKIVIPDIPYKNCNEDVHVILNRKMHLFGAAD